MCLPGVPLYFTDPFVVPLVVVFTKLDLLMGKLYAEALEGGKLPDDAALKERKLESLERLCLGPVRTAAGGENVPHVAVSSTSVHCYLLSSVRPRSQQRMATRIVSQY